jgi:hypothetical protein
MIGELDSMADEELQKKLKKMVNKSIKDLKEDIAKSDHPITRLVAIARHEGYGIALQELGADTSKLGTLVETEAIKIEPSIRKFFD